MPLLKHFSGGRRILSKSDPIFFAIFLCFVIKTLVPASSRGPSYKKIKCCRNKLIHYLDGEMLIPEPHGVWSRVHVDLNGPLPVTARNNKYILVVADSSSKFTVLVPLPNKTAYTVARRLLDHVHTTPTAFPTKS